MSARFVWLDRGWWPQPGTGVKKLLTWNQASQTLVFCALHRWEEDVVLARFTDEDEVVRCLRGWEDHNSQGDFVWLAERLKASRRQDPEGMVWLLKQIDRAKDM